MLPSSTSDPLPAMPKHTTSSKSHARQSGSLWSCFLSDCSVFTGGAMAALLFVWALWTVCNSFNPAIINFSSSSSSSSSSRTDSLVTYPHDPSSLSPSESPGSTFYDDPTLDYTIGAPLKDWDRKRSKWMASHTWITPRKVILVTGSQPTACKNPTGDHLLLRFFKNKADYCRLHGYDIFYNNVLLEPKMHTFWAKLPAVKAVMISHPETEWVWWVDSDAAITDMEFTLPLEKYSGKNLIVHGWENMVYENRSWVALNAGVFLMRNCQWSMDFMEVWAKMGPQTPDYDEWGRIQTSVLSDRMFKNADDQSGLVYLLLKEKEKWGDKIFLENSFYFEGYWVEIVGKLDNVSKKYEAMERADAALRRRHAEKSSELFSPKRDAHLRDEGHGQNSLRRPFITHFTGCQPCSGDHNKMYSGKNCYEGMVRVLNFADNQVLRNFGFYRKDLLDTETVFPAPFDFPVQ
ncbi:unnamed protein product [Victoria cruziana]